MFPPNHFLHPTGVPLRSTPAGEKCVRLHIANIGTNEWLGFALLAVSMKIMILPYGVCVVTT